MDNICSRSIPFATKFAECPSQHENLYKKIRVERIDEGGAIKRYQLFFLNNKDEVLASREATFDDLRRMGLIEY